MTDYGVDLTHKTCGKQVQQEVGVKTKFKVDEVCKNGETWYYVYKRVNFLGFSWWRYVDLWRSKNKAIDQVSKLNISYRKTIYEI